jgi:hypothetical protein
VPNISPWERISPCLSLEGTNYHNFLPSSAGTLTPLGTKTEPDFSAITWSGLWIPSKIWSKIPGPS